jgi:selT/selW/selH-like putative selenoprotein
LGITPELVKGDRGIFEVRADGVKLYSKKECGDRFPTDAEVIKLIRDLDPKG